MAKSLSEKRDENPAYYDSFSKRIKEVLELYKNQVISEAQYYEKMKEILKDYQTGKSSVSYPERIKNNVHAQAFYGVLNAIFSDSDIDVGTSDFIAEIAERITAIIAGHSQ